MWKRMVFAAALMLAACGESDLAEGDFVFVDDGSGACGEFVTFKGEDVIFRDQASGGLMSAPWDMVVKVPGC